MVFERSPPHLFLYLLFIQKKNNTNMDSTGFESPGVKFLLRQGAWNALATEFLFFSIFIIYIYFIIFFIMAYWAWRITLQGEEMNEDTQGMWNIYLMELTNHWTKMQELSSIFIKPNLALCSAWLLVRLSPSGAKEGCMSVRVFTLLLGCILFISCKRLVDNKYSRNA